MTLNLVKRNIDLDSSVEHLETYNSELSKVLKSIVDAQKRGNRVFVKWIDKKMDKITVNIIKRKKRLIKIF